MTKAPPEGKASETTYEVDQLSLIVPAATPTKEITQGTERYRSEYRYETRD